ncbi:transcriptional antitermination N peptide [Edwardsiella tarda]
MNAQERRREKRKEKANEWKKNNPLLVGISAKPNGSSEVKYKRRVNRAEVAALCAREREVTAGSICMPDVAIYYAGYRKQSDVSARG